MLDVKQIGDAVIAAVKGYVDGAVSKLAKRVDDFEMRIKQIPAGRSAYAIAVERGYAGTELQWLDSLRGESVQGESGKDADPEFIRAEVARAVDALPKPKDGKDVAPEQIEAMVARAVEAIPKPKDGESVTQEQLCDTVKAALAEWPRPENGKDADPELIRATVAEAIATMPKPKDGTSVTIDDVAPIIVDLVKSEIAALPKPENGKDADPEFIRAEIALAVDALPKPENGKDADPELIRATVAEAIATMPKPKDGTSVTIDDVAPLIADKVKQAVSEIPVPENGKDADPAEIIKVVSAAIEAIPKPQNGKDADPELIRKMVADAVAAIPKPKDGIDGKSITVEDFRQLFEAEQAKWALDFERRATDVLQRAIERMPPAKDGRDAFELDDIELTQSEDGRRVTLAFRRGDEVREKHITLPCLLDRGVYRPKSDYVKGDGVTWDGSFFIAQKDDPVGTPGESDDWRLVVKRGQNGKDFRPDAPASPILPVRLK